MSNLETHLYVASIEAYHCEVVSGCVWCVCVVPNSPTTEREYFKYSSSQKMLLLQSISVFVIKL